MKIWPTLYRRCKPSLRHRCRSIVRRSLHHGAGSLDIICIFLLPAPLYFDASLLSIYLASENSVAWLFLGIASSRRIRFCKNSANTIVGTRTEEKSHWHKSKREEKAQKNNCIAWRPSQCDEPNSSFYIITCNEVRAGPSSLLRSDMLHFWKISKSTMNRLEQSEKIRSSLLLPLKVAKQCIELSVA